MCVDILLGLVDTAGHGKVSEVELLIYLLFPDLTKEYWSMIWLRQADTSLLPST